MTIDSELRFEEHISEKVRKANTIVGLIRRSFSFLDCQLFKKLYITFVRPHLEYAQAVWAPHLSKHINMIVNVQIRATKLVDGLGGLDYTKRLKKLDLPTLPYRRARGDKIELFKHFHAYDKATLPLSFQPRNRISRKHNFQLVRKLPKDGTRGLQANSFYYRTTQIWNTRVASELFLLPHHTNMEHEGCKRTLFITAPHKYGTRGLQANSFYYRTTQIWNTRVASELFLLPHHTNMEHEGCKRTLFITAPHKYGTTYHR